MSQDAVSKRYAVALFQLANEKSILDEVEVDLKAVEASLLENRGFLTLLKQPKVSKEKKKTMVKEVFSGVSEIVMNTLLLLLDRKREDIILDLVNQFFELANEERGIAEAKVYSVKPLSEDEEKALSEMFAKRINKSSLRIQNIVDESIIGGVKLRIGNRIYDGSVQGKLERIERQLISAKS